MQTQKPKLYYDDKGNPKGYRVGITDGVYGICPFCGKPYSAEDINNPNVINFEHILSRFAIKHAIAEKSKFERLESEFMVAVHKDCNEKYGDKLEQNVSRLLNNFNKPRVQLTKKDVDVLFMYFTKIQTFLQYLVGYEQIPDEIYGQEFEKYNEVSRLEVFFVPNHRGVGLYHDFNATDYISPKDRVVQGASFSISDHSCRINFVYNDIVFCFKGSMGAFCKLPEVNSKCYVPLFFAQQKDVTLYGVQEKNIQILRSNMHVPWGIDKFRGLDELSLTGHSFSGLPSSREMQDSIQAAIEKYPGIIPYSQNLAKRLSAGGKPRKIDNGIIFYKEGRVYQVQNENCVDVSDKGFQQLGIGDVYIAYQNISKLPNMSNLRVMNFDCSGNPLVSLVGAPKEVQGDFYCIGCDLLKLKGGPRKVGGVFFFDILTMFRKTCFMK